MRRRPPVSGDVGVVQVNWKFWQKKKRETLESKMRSRQTLGGSNCGACGNPWWFDRTVASSSYECTTCGHKQFSILREESRIIQPVKPRYEESRPLPVRRREPEPDNDVDLVGLAALGASLMSNNSTPDPEPWSGGGGGFSGGGASGGWDNDSSSSSDSGSSYDSGSSDSGGGSND